MFICCENVCRILFFVFLNELLIVQFRQLATSNKIIKLFGKYNEELKTVQKFCQTCERAIIK